MTAFWDKFRKKSPTAPKTARFKVKKSELAEEKSEAAFEEPLKNVPRGKVLETGEAYRVLLAPVVTEKSAALQELGKYVFAIRKDANKLAVRRAVEKVYGVRPVHVTVVRMKGRKVTFGRIRGVTASWKKAVVTLKPGDKIQLFEGV